MISLLVEGLIVAALSAHFVVSSSYVGSLAALTPVLSPLDAHTSPELLGILFRAIGSLRDPRILLSTDFPELGEIPLGCPGPEESSPFALLPNVFESDG